ncbi:glycosyltransferase family 2 protein [Candidatus Azambacteria bacterium]|nr:glycosyltransferase family 2 protein [Candidatus Azambacteria bacterium]
MEQPLVSINLVVWNGKKYIRECLEAVKRQTYDSVTLTVFDNHSTDGTQDIVKKEFSEFRLIENHQNYGFGPGQNKCLEFTKGKYVLGLCVDVMLDKDFVKNAVVAMETHPDVGAVQAKIYQLRDGKPTDVIDTTGFEIFRSRRVVNRGHGEKDKGQYKAGEVFSYEGAAPFWRREALEQSKVLGEAHDEDYFWYADDIYLGWRMRLFGWKSYYAPDVVAFHDRQTTKRLSRSWFDFMRLRTTVPAHKRRLDWQNLHFTFLKNDFFISELKDLRYFFVREFFLLCYVIIFEPFVLQALSRMFHLLPRVFRKRRYIMAHKKIARREMEKWFQ